MPRPYVIRMERRDSAESATANLVTGPALAVADRARDLVREAVRKAED